MNRLIAILPLMMLLAALTITTTASTTSAEETRIARMDQNKGKMMKPMPIRTEAITDMKMLDESSLELWSDTKLGKSGKSCASCHPDGMLLSKRAYPRYIKMTGDILTLDQMINFCMKNPMKAKPLKWNSKEMTTLAHYVTMHSKPSTKSP